MSSGQLGSSRRGGVERPPFQRGAAELALGWARVLVNMAVVMAVSASACVRLVVAATRGHFRSANAQAKLSRTGPCWPGAWRPADRCRCRRPPPCGRRPAGRTESCLRARRSSTWPSSVDQPPSTERRRSCLWPDVLLNAPNADVVGGVHQATSSRESSQRSNSAWRIRIWPLGSLMQRGARPLRATRRRASGRCPAPRRAARWSGGPLGVPCAYSSCAGERSFVAAGKPVGAGGCRCVSTATPAGVAAWPAARCCRGVR
jgi:hypothetical protein